MRSPFRGGAARAALLVLLAAVGLALWPAPAGAHPLGNFTVNRYARVEVSGGVVHVLYVYDAAEIPAFQQRAEVEADPAAFARRRAGDIGGQLRLTVDGERVPLAVAGADLVRPGGQGGLPTLRLSVGYTALLPAGDPSQPRRISFADGNEPDRVGWREIVVVARGEARVTSSDAPAADATDELRAYPDDMLRAPLDRRAATFVVVPGRVAAPAPALSREAAPRAAGGFAGLLDDRGSGPLVVAGLLLLAVGFGAVHALAPGHGKTIMAAYLVGTRGRSRDALALGAVVSLMHTVSVLVLGLVLVRVNQTTATERIYPWLTLASGVVVTVVGASLLLARWRTLRRSHAGSHDHDHPHDRAHGHDHAHDHGHHHHGHHHHGPGGHTHDLPAGASPLSRRGLVLLGASGGLFPSPSAVVVLVSAFALHRAALGLALIAAFSVGLAATLSGVGLLLVHGRSVVERRWAGRAVARLPLAGAAALVLLGVVVTTRGLTVLGT